MRCCTTGHVACNASALTISRSLPLQTPYFLITDADTFFIRELEALTLLDQQDCTPDSSICDLQRKVETASSCICVATKTVDGDARGLQKF
jgi:hypothetical protein